VQGFKSAFLPYREKAELLAQVNREIAEVRARFAAPPPGGPG
jgi:adenosine deaminase